MFKEIKRGMYFVAHNIDILVTRVCHLYKACRKIIKAENILKG